MAPGARGIGPDGTGADGRRPYNSPIRRQQAAETRERIVTAGSAIAHALPSWDWSELTFKAVADKAGVGQRTVYRYFPTERILHDAVMARLEEEAGVSYEDLTVDTVGQVAWRVFDSMASFTASASTPSPVGSTMDAEDDRRRRALQRAVEQAAPAWTPAQRRAAAAAFDVIWAAPSYERLVLIWQLDHRQAMDVITWMLSMLVGAIRSDQKPPPRRRAPKRG
ncbi:MAG: TetR/AcrR family transcriptional regulator [Actinomycetota bacterium]|nr:TetR/AcrR family transcriptional regulator [Actinomycetota bacterium]